MTSEKPDGPLSGVFWEYDRQIRAGGRHAAAEGHDIGARALLESYDRTLHPWMHGRRPADLAERYGDEIELVGFVIGAALSILLFGPIRLVQFLRWWSP